MGRMPKSFLLSDDGPPAAWHGGQPWRRMWSWRPGVDVRGAWHLQGAGGGVRPHGVEGAHQDPAGAAREPRGPEHSFFACVLVVEWIGYSKCYHLEKRPHIVVSVVVSQVPK